MKMKIILSALIVFTVAACKKDSPPANQSLLQDGPMSAQLGKLIYLGDQRYFRSWPIWGRNSDELFINVSTELLRVDFVTEKIEVLENSGGLATGKTNENSGVIFLGTIGNQLGYYVFNFSGNNIERIIAVPNNQGTAINIAGNNIFYYQSSRAFCASYILPFRQTDTSKKQI